MGRRPHVLVEIPRWVIPKWWLVAYKIPPPLAGKFAELTNVAPDERFEAEVSKMVQAAIAGQMPANQVVGPILNMANDLMNGRDMVIRTGDYIVLQEFLASQG